MIVELAKASTSGECHAIIKVGIFTWDVTGISKSELRNDLLAFARRLRTGHPFTAAFANEPRFNVEFRDRRFVAYVWRPKFPQRWLHWLGSKKWSSQPEDVNLAVNHLTTFAEGL